MPAAPEQLTAAQLDEVEPLWAQLHAHHAALAMPPAMRARPLEASWRDRKAHDARGIAPMLIGVRESNGEALDLYARLGAQPAFVIMALP
jgi:hypothetical protein